ncbi:MAG: chemotaxis protein CheD [Spartobacteria bacterium]|nr:chemotaxis protein CheD [Spartobacteria bacterium]
MSTIIVDIAQMQISANPEDRLITYSLGSCIGVTVYDPVACVGGLIHCMLPLSSVDRNKAELKPAMFVDTGIPMLLREIFALGARKNSLIIKVAGGSQVLDKQGMFRIGERNYTVFRKVLWKNGLLTAAEDVGGDISRTMSLSMKTGDVVLKTQGQERLL